MVPFALVGLGRVADAAPVHQGAGGGQRRRDPRALRPLLLAFAAETAGLGPDRPLRHDYFEPRFYTEHGGAVGEGLYWATTTLFQRLGAHIAAVVMFVSGALLLSGATVAGVLDWRRARGQRAHHGRARWPATMRAARGRWRARGAGLGRRRRGDRDHAAPTSPSRILTRTSELEEPETERTTTRRPGPTRRSRSPRRPTPRSSPTPSDDETAGARRGPARPRQDADGQPPRERGHHHLGRGRLRAARSRRCSSAARATRAPTCATATRSRRRCSTSLQHFGVEARLLGVVSGPHVSRYELQLAPGTKVGKIAQLKDDLAYALASTDIRILAPIPGKKAVGVEVPNQKRRLVRLGDIYDGRPKGASPLSVWLGKDVSGHASWTDLALMPHALVAGTTGSGKSGCINAMLCSILLHASPNEVRMVLVDPKRVELNHYEKLPHLLTPVVTNPRLAANVLGNLIGEMESRYQVMGEARARNLPELNKVRRRNGEAPLPHILCVIDELADLMMVAPAEVEDSIIRLAQKSRAVGIHLVLATQRPSTDVITGTIKVNIPARIAFAVASQVDSRVILDAGGAESLLGQGDMLFRPIGTSKLSRVQGAFVTEEEIARIAKHWAKQGEPDFDVELLEAKPDPEGTPGDDGEFSPDEDDLLTDAARVVVESETASVSMIQRRLRVGYTRAGRLIDMLERRGIISGYEGSKPRQVLVSMADLPRILEGGSAAAPEPSDTSDLEPVGG